MKLTPPPSCTLSGHLSGLFAPGLNPVTFRTRTAGLLRAVADCQLVSFAKLDPGTRRLDVDFDPFSPELAVALTGFGRHMASHPCFNFDPTVAGVRPFLRGDFLSDAEFYASPIYLEGFKLAGISDHAAIPLPAADGTVFFIGLEKCDGRTFLPAHRDVLTALQPHLANACQLSRALVSAEQPIRDPATLRRAGFSPREADTLSLIAIGKSNAEIAAVLDLGMSTIKGHVAAIFNKLGVDNRHAARPRTGVGPDPSLVPRHAARFRHCRAGASLRLRPRAHHACRCRRPLSGRGRPNSGAGAPRRLPVSPPEGP